MSQTKKEEENKSLPVDAELEKLNEKYLIKDMDEYKRITLEWKDAAWEIQNVWELYNKEQITSSKARELTRYIIDSYAEQYRNIDKKSIHIDEIKKNLLEKEGFDFNAFEFENEFSAKAILKAMNQYRNLPNDNNCDSSEHGLSGYYKGIHIKYCLKCKIVW